MAPTKRPARRPRCTTWSSSNRPYRPPCSPSTQSSYLGPPSVITLQLFETVLLEPQRLRILTDGAPLRLIESRRIEGRDFDPNVDPRAVEASEWLKDFVDDLREVRAVSLGVQE